jgi:hypothetical protein
MREIKKMYMLDEDEKNPRSSATGLVIELEDGTMLQHQSSDVVMTFGPYEPYQSPDLLKKTKTKEGE